MRQSDLPFPAMVATDELIDVHDGPLDGAAAPREGSGALAVAGEAGHVYVLGAEDTGARLWLYRGRCSQSAKLAPTRYHRPPPR